MSASWSTLLDFGDVNFFSGGDFMSDEKDESDESDNDTAVSDGDVPDSCYDVLGWNTPLHYLNKIPASSAHAYLRNGASIHAAGAPGGPTPLSLARWLHAKGRAAEGSAAALVLKAAEPWSPASHELFPDPARAHAVQLLLVGHSLSRLPKHESVAQAIFDIWLFHVMPHVVVRESE